MNYIKACTETGVKFKAQLKTKGDYQRAINFLEHELLILDQTAFSKKQKKQHI